MSEIQLEVERLLDAPAPAVYETLADYQRHHHQILPAAFTDYRVEEGGFGAGTVISFTVTVGGRPRRYRDVISEPAPGQVLVETDREANKVTTFTLEPRGEQTLVRIATRFPAAGGLAGVIERAFAPRMLRPLYVEELERLGHYASSLAAPAQAAAVPAGVPAR